MSQIVLPLQETSLDIVSRQKILINEALGADGVYIRMKETLSELLEKGDMSEVVSAKTIADTVSKMAESITANSMNIALSWATKERELEMQKTELEYKLSLLSNQAATEAENKKSKIAEYRFMQAKTIGEYGTPGQATGDVTSLGSDGKISKDIELVNKEIANKTKLNTQIDSQTTEVQARTHKLIADTYVNHGTFSGYTVSDSGVTNVVKTSSGYETLSEINAKVSNEQAKGYAWNAWASAASSSSGMIGTLVATESANLVDEIQSSLTTWKTAVTALNSTNPPA